MKTKSILKGIFLPVIVVLVFGCSTSKDVKTIQGDPALLYKEGLALFNKRIYPDALTKFQEVKSSFPDSPPFTTWAELKVGDCHYLSGEFVEAIAAYEEFKKVHPTHEEMPYVQYQIGMSYFSQMSSSDRDQSAARKALSSFEYLVANYPPSLFTEKGKGKMEICTKRLAEQEFYVGDFYYRRGQFAAAARRFEGLLEQFPKMEQEDRTLFFLGKSYLELNQTEPARSVFIRLVTDYPQSHHYKEAKGILDGGVKGKAVSAQKTAARGLQGAESVETGRVRVALARFEEEGRKPLSLTEEKKLMARETEEQRTPPSPIVEKTSPVPSRKDIEPKKESPGKAVSQEIKGEEKPGEPLKIAFIPGEEGRKGIPPPPAPKIEPNSVEEIQRPSSSLLSPVSKEKENVPPRPGPLGVLGTERIVDAGQPIEITSDKVESYTKENLIVFRGNVTARQKDIVIYADSIEAVIAENGKGIEKAVADGNVKIQQGLRVASCQKAVFYNLDRKVILTGGPRLWEGDNMVSGEEIVFDIDQNRVDVKGGPGGRGKAKIQP